MTATSKIRDDFFRAACNGETEKLRETLSRHPEAVHWKNSGAGRTALAGAARVGRLEDGSVTLLIEWGSDVNALDDKGATPLMCAAVNGSVEIARLLLEKGADADIRGPRGRTAAEAAEAEGRQRNLAVAGFIRAYMLAAAEKRESLAVMESEAAQAHAGLDRPVSVCRPLVLKR